MNVDDTSESTGFIILRHVNSPQTNDYWNRCYDSIRKFYPEHKIVIIDDNSDYSLITERTLYKTTIIQSEYPRRGELLPYYYYLKYNFFDTAVIIHDSVFINAYIDLHTEAYTFFWDFEHTWDQIEDETNMINAFNDAELMNLYKDKSLWRGCFGGMMIINYDYLQHINTKYDISKLLDFVKTRYNRSSFERVIACLLISECECHVMFGTIYNYILWGTSWENIHKRWHNFEHLPIIKVWSGR
jgi:hypothetical protein